MGDPDHGELPAREGSLAQLIRAHAAPLLLAAILLLPGAGSVSASSFPQLKIDRVDLQRSSRVQVRFSLLDRRRRQVSMDRLQSVTLMRKPEGARAEPIFTWKADEITWEGGLEPTEEPPTLKTVAEAEVGLQAMVVVAGHADAAHIRGSLGQRIRQGLGLFPKKLGRAEGMNVLWAGDQVRTWVRERGRLGSLSPLTSAQLARCEAWKSRERDEDEEEESKKDEELAEDESHCGMASDVSPLPEILERTEFEGYYPHLFGLDAPLCGQPEHGRSTQGLKREDTVKGAVSPGGESAFVMALRTMVQDGNPDGEQVLILLGDGEDGYLYPAGECRAFVQRRCSEDNDTWRARKLCMEKSENQFLVASQERFRERLGPWVALARAAGIRIFSVIHPDAPDHGRERLELLAWRTGGTARVAEDANEVVDRTSDLIDELHGQLVLSFEDERAVEGANLRYRARVKVGGATYRTAAMGVHVPLRASGLVRSLGDVEALGRARLGDTGFLVLAGVLALLLAFVGLKLLRRLLGRMWGSA
mgnify:CR=1 FL=1